MNLLVNKKAFELFKRRAKRHYPTEYMEVLWGRTDSTTIYIEEFIRLSIEPTKDEVSYDYADIMATKQDAKANGLVWIGTIHTHCGLDTCPYLSEADHHSGILHNELISGVLHIWCVNQRYKTAVNWGLPTRYT